MIDTVTVAGLPMDPCHVLAQVTVLHGRGGFGEPGQASSATITIEHPTGSMPSWRGGDIVTLDGPQGRMFAGRIVERSLGHVDDADGTRWGQFTVTAAGALAALGVRKIGDEPWPQELGTERAAKILSAAGTLWSVDGTADLTVLPRDVDAQPAAGLLDDLAADTGAAVFDTPTGEVVYQPLSGRAQPTRWMWSDFDPALAWSGFDPALTWDGAAPTLASWISPTSPQPLPLPCAAVVWEPEWSASESTVINHVRVGFGIAEPQDIAELSDTASIAQHQRRYLYLGTQLATAADATSRASQILTTQAEERWQIGDITVALDQLDAATHTAVLGLLCGDHVILQGLPQPAPAIDWTGIVEGWTFTQWADDGGGLNEQMVLALSDPLLSLAVFRWDEYPGTYLWSQHPTNLTWNDLTTTSALEAA